MVSCAGPNVEVARRRLARGECCLAAITDPSARNLRARYAGLIADAESRVALRDTHCAPFDRFVQLGVVAAREALHSARLDPTQFGRRLGLVFSTCSGPMLLIENHYERLLRNQPSPSSEELEARRYYTGARVLAQHLGIQGPVTTVVTACSASSAAIALGTDLIRCGIVDAVLAGGADAFSVSTLAGFDGLKATTEGRCAPFSKPVGLNLGEAGAFVVLEGHEISGQRNVEIHGEVLGSGMSNDGLHPSAPDPSGRGLALAMQRALDDAGLTAAAINHINAHGTGTEANDKAEAKAMHRVFRSPIKPPTVSSTKSLMGHNLGAAGAVEVIATLLSAEQGMLPVTANFTKPREACAVDCVTQPGQAWKAPRVFLKNNLAFGGHNTSLVISAETHPETGVASARAPAVSEAPIVLTGCGVVTAPGPGWEGLLAALNSGQSALCPDVFPGLEGLRVGRVDDARVEASERRLDLRGMDRSSRWATVATQLALRDAAYPRRPAALARLGLYLHLATGPSWAENEYLSAYLGHDRQVTQLNTFPFIVPGSVTGNVSRALLLSGHNVTLSAGPGAGLAGLIHARAALRAGHTPALLTGAVDELTERIVSDRHRAGEWGGGSASRPPGEGAVVWLLETEEHARARGATVQAVLLATASGTEAVPGLDPSGPSKVLAGVIQEALGQAQVCLGDVEGLCVEGCRDRVERTLAELAPGHDFVRSDVSAVTGQLEAAQSLLDLAAAWRTSRARLWLAVLSSGRGQHEAVILKRVDRRAPAPS